jgi:hypothetical protein
MVIRARLSAPQPKPREEWPYHKTEWAAISANVLAEADRRMEAETYLASGYGIRLAIESVRSGWIELSNMASVWQPSRLKGIQVSPEFGTPFLAATQVFDIRPIPRKWLAIERTHEAKDRFVERGTILVTCSGSVGRATLAFSPHLDALITHDLLRVKARDKRQWGWLYAYLRAPKVRAMMTGSQYGHIIKHLETSHLDVLPIPILQDSLVDTFDSKVGRILELRERAHEAMLEAEGRFEHALGALKVTDAGENGFTVRAASTFFDKRRRMDALPHNPAVGEIRKHLATAGKGFSQLGKAGFRIWLPSRFRRIPAEDGVEFVNSSDLFEINPDLFRRISDGDFGDPNLGRVNQQWLLLARSGQIYGLLGNLVLATDALKGKVISDDAIRIAPTEKPIMRTGYILVALSHPTLGRPLLKSIAYGSSIPHIEPADLEQLAVVRLAKNDENRIADLAEQSAELRGQADVLETQIAGDAEEILNQFIAGHIKLHSEEGPNGSQRS